MVPHMIRAIAAGLAFIILSPGLGTPATSKVRCSLAPFSGFRSAHQTHFIGIAAPDTVEAGPGAVKFNLEAGHSGYPRPRLIYGQVVRIERIGGAHAEVLREHFARSSSREVILVPWDYDAGCKTSLWPGSTRWIKRDRPGFFTVTLRPQEYWVGGRPTFDAFMAALEPYPHGEFYRHGYRGTDALKTGPSLSAEEYYTLYEALPDGEEFRRDPREATKALRQWKREHPALARKYPATEILEDIQYLLENAQG